MGYIDIKTYAEQVKNDLSKILIELNIPVDKVRWFIESRINPVNGKQYTLDDIGLCMNGVNILDNRMKGLHPKWDGCFHTESFIRIMNYNLKIMRESDEETAE